MSKVIINIPRGKKFFFLSDFHLKNWRQTPDTEAREKKVVEFINGVQHEAAGFLFLGDIFDFWFEHSHLIPKGNIRIQAKWLELKELNIPVFFISGNHDRWTRDYFATYLGMRVFHETQMFLFNEKIKIVVGHGDSLGHGDFIYKVYRKFVTNKTIIWMARAIHPSFFYRLAYTWISSKHRSEKPKMRLPDEKEWLIQFSKKYLSQVDSEVNYFIFGHRHLAIEAKLSDTSTYINTGEWISLNSYAVFENNKIQLKQYLQ